MKISLFKILVLALLIGNVILTASLLNQQIKIKADLHQLITSYVKQEANQQGLEVIELEPIK